WKTDALIQYNILSTDFRIWTLFGGVGLAGITVVRGIALWAEVGRNRLARANKRDHGHEHGEACDHEHGETHAHDHDHEAHDHDHGHDHGHEHDEHAHANHHRDHGHVHGFAPWRYAVLLMPLMLAA